MLETDEFNVFISACRAFFTKYDFTMIYLAIWGMRRGEVMGENINILLLMMLNSKYVLH